MIIRSIDSNDYLNLSFKEQFEYDLAQKDEIVQVKRKSLNIKENEKVLQDEFLSLKNERTALDNELDCLNNELISIEDNVNSLDEELVSLKDEALSLKNVICEKDKEINRLKESLGPGKHMKSLLKDSC